MALNIITLSTMTHIIMTLSIIKVTVTLSINDTQYNNTEHKHQVLLGCVLLFLMSHF
jgi:hypothetical protein